MTPVPVVIVGSLALLANVGVAMLLGGAGGGLGVRSAALHVIADALTDAAVVIGAVTLLLFGWTRADAVVSLLIACLVFAGAVGLLREALHILNEGTPRDLDVGLVRERMAALPGIDGVHDLHIWSLDREHRALSAHVIVADRPLGEVTEMIRSVELLLCQEFGIEHATVQPECPSCSAEAPLYCNIAGHHELVHPGCLLEQSRVQPPDPAGTEERDPHDRAPLAMAPRLAPARRRALARTRRPIAALSDGGPQQLSCSIISQPS